MPGNPLGLNILGDRSIDEGALITHIKAAKPRYVVVMNNPGLAKKIVADCPATTVIYREWENDDDAHKRGDARKFVQKRHKLAPAGALLYLGNEPLDNWEKLDSWTLTALDECEKLGRRGVIYNFSTGRPEPQDWRTLAKSIERAFTGRHLVGLHEYFDVTIAKSQKWHIGRFEFLREFAGERCPEIVITELGCAIGMDAHKGWRSGLSQAQYADQLTAAGDFYGRRGIASCIFSYGNWETFGIEAATEVLSRIVAFGASLAGGGAGTSAASSSAAAGSGASGTGSGTAAVSSGGTTMSTHVAIPAGNHPGWVHGTVSALGSNMRTQPDIQAPVVVLLRGSMPGRWQRPRAQGGFRVDAPEQVGAEWIPIILDNNGGTGWMRSDVITLVEDAPVTPVSPGVTVTSTTTPQTPTTMTSPQTPTTPITPQAEAGGEKIVTVQLHLSSDKKEALIAALRALADALEQSG